MSSVSGVPPEGARFVMLRPGEYPAVGPVDGVLVASIITMVGTTSPAFVGFLGLGSDPETGDGGAAPVSTRMLVFSVSPAIKGVQAWNPTDGPTAVCPEAENYFDRLGGEMVVLTSVDVGTESTVGMNGYSVM